MFSFLWPQICDTVYHTPGLEFVQNILECVTAGSFLCQLFRYLHQPAAFLTLSPSSSSYHDADHFFFCVPLATRLMKIRKLNHMFLQQPWLPPVLIQFSSKLEIEFQNKILHDCKFPDNFIMCTVQFAGYIFTNFQ